MLKRGREGREREIGEEQIKHSLPSIALPSAAIQPIMSASDVA